MLRLFALPFLVVPLVELYLLLWLSRTIDFLPTLALVLVTGAVGAWLAHREGTKALAAFRRTLSEGKPPEVGLIEGALILVGGVLLITPGVLTDLVGFVFLLPHSRRIVARRLRERLLSSVAQAVTGGQTPGARTVIDTTGHEANPDRGRY